MIIWAYIIPLLLLLLVLEAMYLKYNNTNDMPSGIINDASIIVDSCNNKDFAEVVNRVDCCDNYAVLCAIGKVYLLNKNNDTFQTLLEVSGASDWRCCWKDTLGNIYVSPHSSAISGEIDYRQRGLYRIDRKSKDIEKVLSFDEEDNDITIWTMCEDDLGNLYAGIYSHTKKELPLIVKSTNNGKKWSECIDFNKSGLTKHGKHIHSVIFSCYEKKLYAIVGEVNTIFCSSDYGCSWTNLEVRLNSKGASMYPLPYGLLIGSDSAYACEIDLIYNINHHKNLFSGWANTIFGIRQSDISGYLYAFSKIDYAVYLNSYYPPVESLTNNNVLTAWLSEKPKYKKDWLKYNQTTKTKYPEDCIRPRHFAILISRNGGKQWEVLHKIEASSMSNSGIWTIGQFYNGECWCGQFIDGHVHPPLIIKETLL